MTKTRPGNSVIPTTTATQARVRLFQPTQRPARINIKFETQWGACRVNGRLGQRHADLLESILHAAERRRETDDGAIELLVDPARVRATLSDSRYSLQQIGTLVDDLVGAIIEIETKGVCVIGGLVSHIIKTEMTRLNPLSMEGRHLWTVRLGLPLTELIRRDLALFYDPAPLARLRYGVSQAVARHALTHKNQPNGGWKLDGLIEAVAGAIPAADLRKARRRVREDAAGMQLVGLIIDGDRVFSVPHPPGGALKNRKNVPHPPDSVPHPPGKTRKRATPARFLQDSSGILSVVTAGALESPPP